MMRNWGTTTNTHWRGRFYNRNVKTWANDIVDILTLPFKLFGYATSELATISWSKLLKVCAMVIVTSIATFIIYVAIQYIRSRDAIVQQHLVELQNDLKMRRTKYLQAVDESYAIQVGKLDELKMQTIELEERMTANGMRIPVYVPKQRAKVIWAERLNGTGKSLGKVKIVRKQR